MSPNNVGKCAADTLTSIALQKFGTAAKAQEILALNGDRVTAPTRLKIGTKLRLPEKKGKCSLVERRAAVAPRLASVT